MSQEKAKFIPALGTDADMEKSVKLFEDCLHTLGKGTINETIAPTFYACSVSERTYTAAIETGAWMGNPWGTLHGGIIATAFDSCMGIAAFYFGGGRMTQTLSMDVSYLRPGILGQKLFIRSRGGKIGKEIQYVTAEAWCEEHPEKTVATASGVYYSQSGMLPFDMEAIQQTGKQ